MPIQRSIPVQHALLAALWCAVATGDDVPHSAPHRFKLTIEGRIEMEIQKNKQEIETMTELVYVWSQQDRERELSFASMMVKASKDGRPLMHTSMDRRRVTNTQGEVVEEVPFDEAPAQLQSMLRDTFDAAICRCEVNSDGVEVKRTVVAGPGAGTLIENGAIANARLFHPPFYRARDTWNSETEFSMGNGGYAKGTLTYTKTAEAGDLRTYAVSGTLTNDRFPQPGNPLVVKDSRYVVTGEQVYDTKRREWVSGRLAANVSYGMVIDKADVGSAQGTMKLAFEVLPEPNRP